MKWFCIFGLVLAGCAAEPSASGSLQATVTPPAPVSTPSAPPAPPGDVTTANAEAGFPGAVGEKVTLTGAFSGWKGSCRGLPPVSRSDWMLTTDQGCIYVHGPVPDGFSSASPEAGKGKSVAVHGFIKVDARGKKYLDAK